MTTTPPSPGLDDPATEALLRLRRFFQKKVVSLDLRTLHQIGGRDADCLEPGLMETIKPGGKRNDGSTEEVPR